MTTLSKLNFKRRSAGMLASRVFGKMFVMVGYTPARWTASLDDDVKYDGDGKTSWEVSYGFIADPENAVIVEYATRQQVNTILKNISIKGRMAAA